MNALPIKHQSPHDVIDNLIADFGIKPVLLALAARVFRRKPAKITGNFPNLENQPGIADLDDHLRADLGLPPRADRSPLIDQIITVRRNFY